MRTNSNAEWEPLRTAVIHRPGIEVFFGLLEPYASLFERAFSRYEARNEHGQLEHILRKEFHIEVLRLKDTILERADAVPEIRDHLESMALKYLEYTGDRSSSRRAWEDLEKNSSLLDSGHFFNILLLHPEVSLWKEGVGRSSHLHITDREPLANLYFMRDQQAVTDKGIVLCRMAKPQRHRETCLTGLLWKVLGLEVAHTMERPATFEGGDFIPMNDFALIGQGDRTNRAGFEQMLCHGLGFDEVVVVHQPGHPLIPGSQPDPMINMHLDTYFNVASSSVVIGSELLFKNATVEIFQKEGDGAYSRGTGVTNLNDYIRAKGFEIINITTLEQMSYASNFLCIRDGTILAVEVDRIARDVLEVLSSKAQANPERYGALYAQAQKDYQYLRDEGQFFPHKKEVYQHDIDAYPIILRNLTGGYGGARCMTCTLDRG